MLAVHFLICPLLCLALSAAEPPYNASPPLGPAQEVVLHSFTGGKNGLYPTGGLTIDRAGNLYGTTTDNSTVFILQRVTAGAWQEHELFSFGFNCCNANGTLVLDSEGNIYGNTQAGGEIGGGAIFQLTRSGSEWTESVLHSFLQDPDGFYPAAGPVFDGQRNLYGTTAYGGSGTDQLCNGDVGCGTVYELSPSGSGIWSETVLYSFTGGNDGSNPFAGLILDGQGNLYGTAFLGGAGASGTVFELTPSSGGAWNQTVLYSFKGEADGAFPRGSLAFGSDGNLYGTTNGGGVYGYGTVFRLTPGANGAWQEEVLHAFSNGEDGAYPDAGIVLDSQGNIYGTASEGGASIDGTVFKLCKSGGTYIEHTLYSFLGGSDGAYPEAPLVLDGAGHLFGTAAQGGTINKQQCKTGCGVVFEIIP